jgi:hypothetical protein
VKQKLLGHDQEALEAGFHMCDVLLDHLDTSDSDRDLAVTSLYRLFFPEVFGEFKTAQDRFKPGTLEREIICAELGKLADDGMIKLTEVNIFHELVDGVPAYDFTSTPAIQLELDFIESGMLPLAA